MSKKTTLSLRSVLTGLSASRLGTRFFSVLSLLILTAAFGIGASAQVSTNFEAFTAGVSPHGQFGWTSLGSSGGGCGFLYDHKINTNTAPQTALGFGTKSLRISNYITSGCFDATYSAPVNEAGETAAINGGESSGPRQNHFTAQFSIGSADPSAQQSDLYMSVAPDQGNGARMSYLRFEDQADGIHVIFDEYQDVAPFGGALGDAAGCGTGDDFTDEDIATLSRSSAHTIKFSILFAEGPRNDVAQIFIDGVLVKTGTTWEDYYRYCAEQAPNNQTHTVDSLGFRTGGADGVTHAANLGKGFLIDNFSESSTDETVVDDDGLGSTADCNDSTPAFSTIQSAIDSAQAGDTIKVCAGTYAEQLDVNKAVTLLGPNANINPNTTVRAAEAVIVPTSSDPFNPSFAGPVVTTLSSSGVTLNGFTVDGNNPALTGVQANGIGVDGEFGIYGTETANPDAVITNNIVKNLGEFGIWITSNSQGGARNNNSRITNNKVDNIIGSFGQGIRISDDAWVDVTNNTLTRVRSGVVIENYSGGATPHPASVISGNNISSSRIGIRHNLHYVYTGTGFTISQNTVSPYVQVVQAPGVPAATAYQGIRVESVQQTVPVTVSNNVLTGNNTALSGAGYTRNEGLMLTNAANTSPNIVFSGNTSTDFMRGAFNETPAVPTFTSNRITGNVVGFLLSTDAPNGLTAHFNRIAGNGTGMQNLGGATVNAENNWWGCNYGPGAAGAGCAVAANAATGAVDANPWLTLTTSATPVNVGIGESSAVTSLLTFNSAGADTSGLGTVPNTTPASFAGTRGTVSPASSTTTAGVTGTTFTATTAGTGGVDTTVDGQVVNAFISVSLSCLDVSVPSGITRLTGAPTEVVPVNTSNLTGREVMSTDFTFTYDPAVVTPAGAGPFFGVSLASVGNSNGGGRVLTVNGSTPGTLIISVFGSNPMTGSGPIVNITFNVIGAPGTTSALSLVGFKFNEGSPCSATSNGDITILSGTITGTVTYGNPASLPGVRPVPNASLNAAGSVPVSAVTNSSGVYSLSGMGSGAYTVTPSKTGGTNGALSALDSARIAQFVVNLFSLNATQQTVADVSGAGGVTSFDAALIARYVVNLPNSGSSGTWRFTPVSRSYPNVNTDQTGQDYTALLMGDVTGNWGDPVLFRLLPGNDTKAIGVTAGRVTASPNSEVVVPVTIGDVSGKGVVAYQFDMSYDPDVLAPAANPVEMNGTMSDGLAVTVNSSTPGVLKVVIFGANSLSGSGNLLNLKFTAIGAVGTSSPLSWQEFMLNEAGTVQTRTTDGSVEVTAATAQEASVTGRLLTPFGQGVPNTRVTLTDTTGASRTIISNGFGIYQFGNVRIGETYTISVESRQHTFTPVTVSISGDLVNVDIIAEQ